ncbi:hypothetical protein HJ590_04665 [Naumannella sp. ID2617S]|uniref:Uncharacterized protein n=1 Tax=Enemella dayhoffiae TaxID=2016507 RepID=A0A255GV02_9ACTN|nr:PPA1309 family protein [Enemella dayhoffiae]NNG18873.1 hypothetical protein [Naumannella sp. ID2617S]OYO19471.1 hypothetical protein CGZ93_13500 [Enemella dayhoffiae]
MTDQQTPAEDRRDALIASLIELEHHVGADGWDQPARLFALVTTDDLLAAEPQLAEHLGLRGSAEGHPPGALTAIEQDGFRGAGEHEHGRGAGPDAADETDLPAVLGRIAWPETVDGCALVLERTFLPAGHEGTLPEDPQEAAAYVAAHEQRQELRLVVGVLRDGTRHAVARLVSQPDELLGGAELAPGVAEVLAATLA